MKKILILMETDEIKIKNWGGGRGLIWEIQKNLEKNNQVTVKILSKGKSYYKRLFNQYGGYCFCKIDNDFNEYDFIIVFPAYVVFLIPKTYSKKTIAVGPDSFSLNAASLFRGTENLVHKYAIRYFFLLISKVLEYAVLNRVKKMFVVGRTDQLYMKRNALLSDEYKQKIYFLHHPIITHEYNENNKKIERQDIRNFVFSGDMPEKYQKKSVKDLIYWLNTYLICQKKSINIVIVGKNNEWIYRYFMKLDPTKANVKYINWIDDYRDICIAGKYIHCFPLCSGSGTKNRTLTAIINSVEIITTPIGIENIKYKGVYGVYIRRNMQRFAKEMIRLNKIDISDSYLKWIRDSRIQFIRNMEIIFNKDIDLITKS